MTVFPVILDNRPDYLNGRNPSLLQLPFGTGTLLEYLRDHVIQGLGAPSILTTFDVDTAYERGAGEAIPNLQGVYADADFADLLAEHEPSDWLLLINVAQIPAEGFRLRELIRTARNLRMTTHLVAEPSDSRLAQERVLVDQAGTVRRIQRYYAGVTRVENCATSAAMIPTAVAHVAADDPFVSLPALRRTLTSYDVPTHDLRARGTVFDLSQEEGFFSLNEALLPELVPDGVWFGADCQVAPSARLYGPVVLQDGVVVEEDATLIGPVVVGREGRVGRGAVLAHCVVPSHGQVPADAAVCQRISESADVLGVAPAGNGVGSRRGIGARPGTNGGSRNGHARRPRPRIGYARIKAWIDATLALAGIVSLSPLLVVTALVVKLTSRGPAFFAHGREGKGGREFRCWKFRTMVRDAHSLQRALYQQNQVDGPQFKLDRDPRITHVGHWLRLSNIDELPQLFNVVLGQMSLIGPRPSPFRENQICVPWREARLSVRPGITGLWQICRNERAAGDFHQWIYYDLLYVRHMSVWLDLKIVLATILTAGGRWSVPLHWILPASKLHKRSTVALPTCSPVLGPSRGREPGLAPQTVHHENG